MGRARHDPVGRQHRELLPGRVHEQRQQVIEGRVLLARPGHPSLVAVAERGLVAVVAVGDDDRPGAGGRDQRLEVGRRVAIGRDHPESVANVVLVGDVGRRGAAGDRVQDRPAGRTRVVVQDDDRARVDARRPQQLVAVLARGRERPLVRLHARPGPERLEPQPREESPLRPDDIGPGHAIRLLVDVDRRMRVLVQRPVRAPRGERAGRPPVAVVELIARLVAGQVEADDVRGMPRKQAFVLIGPDDVVRRRDDEAQVGNGRRIVAKGAERTDLGHGTS